MIDFQLNDATPFSFFTETELNEARNDLKYRSDKIREDLDSLGTDKFRLGCHLIDLFNSKAWSADPGWIIPVETLSGKIKGDKSTFSFMQYCERHFGLDKSQVSRYMNIVDEFGDKFLGFAEPWKKYGYSQLTEMLPLTKEQRLEVKPDWTVQQIRDYKKRLAAAEQAVATSQQKENSDSGSSDPVTTSQYKDHFIGMSELPRDFKYCRFNGVSVRYVCDRLMHFEDECKELQKRNYALVEAFKKAEAEAKRYKMQYDNEVAAMSDTFVPNIRNKAVSL